MFSQKSESGLFIRLREKRGAPALYACLDEHVLGQVLVIDDPDGLPQDKVAKHLEGHTVCIIYL